MADKNIYNLEGRTNEQVCQAFITFMGDNNATPKQIKNAATGKYPKIGEISAVCEIVNRLYSIDSIYKLHSSKAVRIVSDALSDKIEASKNEPNVQRELKNVRSYVNKYLEFLEYCEGLKNKNASYPPYVFSEDEDKPFISEENFLKITTLLKRKKNIILEGAPGVGKTFLAQKVAYQLMGSIKDENIEMIQFHQSYSYEDFMQGIRPAEDGRLEVRNGVFYDFCQRARRSQEPFVFIIDEINRGNVSKIFGELMMLIEANKRSEKYAIRLTYSEDKEDKFYVPDNVYIIGCMNTADRSLAIVDYALRRRFAFYRVMPEFNDTFKAYLAARIGKEHADLVIDRITAVNHIIKTTPSLGEGLVIGHSYFCGSEKVKDYRTWWFDLCEYELSPYIQEICFDNEDLCKELFRMLHF